MKKILSLVLALLVAFTVMGCAATEKEAAVPATEAAAADPTATEEAAAGSTATEEAPKVYFLGPMIGGSAWGTCQVGFEERCEELGFEGHYIAPVVGGNVAEMVDLTEMAVSNGANAIIGNWRDNDAFNDVIDRALEKGIVILGNNYRLEGRCENYVGIDPVELGHIQADVLCKNMDGKEIKAIYMVPALTSASHLTNYDAFKERLAELRPNAEMISLEEDTGNATVAYDKIAALLVAHPEINAIVCDTGISSVAAATLSEERNLKDTLYVQGMDDGPDILVYVKSGYCQTTIVQDWYNVGAASADMAKTLLDGGELDGFTGLGAYPLYPNEVDAHCAANGIDIG